MKKLTKKALTEMLKKDYFVANFKAVVEDKENAKFYIIYPYSMIILTYTTYGWSFVAFGEIMRSSCAYYVKLTNTMDDTYNYEA